MNNSSGPISCGLGCWMVGALVGVLAAAALMVMGGWTFLQGAFIGVVVFVVVGGLLSWLICRPLPAPGAVTVSTAAPEKPAAPAPAKAAPAAAAAPTVKPSTNLPGQDELAARKGTWKYESGAAPATTTAAAPAAAAPASADAGEAEPATLSAAREGGADDLKKLKGVGPKLEQTLNELGFYHFDQIAAWTEAEVAWVDSRLKFKGRIQRDGWIEQAKALASGG